MTLESEFKLAFVIDNLKVYRCNRCVSLVLWRDRLEHRQKVHQVEERIREENLRLVREELAANGIGISQRYPVPDTRPISHKCIRCKSDDPRGVWWKCCPTHTTEQGPDVVCTPCAKIWHPNDASIQGWGKDEPVEGQEDRVPDPGADEAHGSSADHGRGT